MTQAVNLANFANSLNSSGQMDPAALSSAVSVSKGGTGSTTASAARTALGVPANDGTGASGTWNISISGTAETATNLVTNNFSIVESGGSLLIKYGATTLITITSSGNISAIGDVTAYYGS